MLEIKNLSASYGLIKALDDVSLCARRGAVTCILGPNGAGKTTLMFSIAGILRPDAGSVMAGGVELCHLDAPGTLRHGVALVPENRLVFAMMSVRENLLAGAYLRPASAKHEILADLEKTYARFPVLGERAEQSAGTLSGGEQQMLAVARALMARPKILLMDEPSVGLSPLIVNEIFSIIAQLNREGITILLVEQNAVKALQVADYFYLLDHGSIAFGGTPDEMENDEVIKRAYLGDREA